MLKSDLLIALNKKHRTLSANDIEHILDLFFNKIKEGLNNNTNIELRGFGTFRKKINKAKYVRNPKTNEKFFKTESFKIHFKVGKILNKILNS